MKSKSFSQVMRIVALAIFALVFWPSEGWAQGTTVSGTVIGDDGLPLIGATVQVVGTTSGTTTDLDGKFSIPEQTLPLYVKVSYIGFQAMSIKVEDAKPLKVTLKSDSELLDAVVVVGYGRQKKKVTTGAIAKIDAEKIEGIAVPDVAATMEGQMAGIVVNESSGQPGSSKTLLIRGVSTNGDNTPLFIVDGVQVDNIDNINPGDVESIDVLKDAASSAIYGARGANGVVIITTKTGGDGEGKITYSASYLNSSPWKLPDMLSAEDYVMITREKYANSGQTAALDLLGFPQVGDALDADTDWMDQIFNPAQMVNHRVTATGKNAYLSFDYWNQDGVIGGDKSNYERFALRLNSTKEVKGVAKLGQSLYLNRVYNNNIGTNNAFGGVQSDAFAYDPITPVMSDSGQYGFAQSPWVQKEYINPESRLFLINGDSKNDEILGNIYLEIEPIENLKIKSDLGVNANWWDFRSFTPSYNFHAAAQNVTNDVAQGSGNFQGYQWENTVNYNMDLKEKHHFDFLVGTTFRTRQFRQVGGATSEILEDVQFNPNFQYLDAGQDTLDLTYGSASVNYVLISQFGRILYDYDEKYMFTATLRRDGSSNFGENNRFGIFPAASVGWVITKEDFLVDNDILNFLKLRASWGINGSDRIAPLSYVARVQNAFTYSFGTNSQSLTTGSALAGPGNPNIKWEESVQIDIGVDAGLFDDRVTVEADVYQKSTKDLLMAENIPGYIGATNNPISNLGEIRNRGIEVSVGYKTSIRDIDINTSLNYTHFRNEVISVAGDAGYLLGWSWPVRNTPITRMSEGFPVGHFVGYQTDGIFQSQDEVFQHINNDGDLLQPDAEAGDIRFVDTNGDGVINSDDIGDIGNPWPKHIIGLSLNTKYKGFYLNTIFNTQIGHDIYRTYERSDVTFSNYQTFWLDRWTEDNPSADLPRLVSTDRNNNQRPSDFYVEDGTFLRMRNLQIGWNVPLKWLEKAKMKELKVYVTANNLFTITKYRGFDPDIGTSGWILDTGIDKGFYPNNRSIGAGLNVAF
jgi:TonB-linked SusC/RagA family outer membrane protein